MIIQVEDIVFSRILEAQSEVGYQVTHYKLS